MSTMTRTAGTTGDWCWAANWSPLPVPGAIDVTTFTDRVVTPAAIASNSDVNPFDMAFRTRVAAWIVNEVRGIKLVSQDIASKPPAMIVWE